MSDAGEKCFHCLGPHPTARHNWEVAKRTADALQFENGVLRARLVEADRILEKAKEMISHAKAIDCFTPGGSTEMWANEVLREHASYTARYCPKEDG